MQLLDKRSLPLFGRLATVVLVLAAVGVATTVASGMRDHDTKPASIPNSSPSGAASSARAEGHIAFVQRSSDLQSIMLRMYDSSSHYRSLSGLFADSAPGDKANSMRVEIRLPDQMRAASYPNLTGSGRPGELSASHNGGMDVYLPAHGTYVRLQHPPGRATRPPLPDVPLGTVASDDTTVTPWSSQGSADYLERIFTFPSELITSPFFTNKKITVGSGPSFEGRPAWQLVGSQVPNALPLGALGDGFRMLVDKQTGIVWRVEYYSGNRYLGWAGFKDVTVDGFGAHDAAAPPAWTLPANAKRENVDEFLQSQRSP